MSLPPPEFRVDLPSAESQPMPNLRFLSLLGGYIDQMVSAADRRDWKAVGQLSGALASGSSAAGASELSGAAEHVVVASQNGSNPANIRRALLRLIGACGRTRRAVPSSEHPFLRP
jgi:hypothetical protein